MQLTKRRIALIGGAAAVTLVTGLAFRPKPVEVEMVTAEKGLLVTTIDEDARTRVPERYEISSPVAGRHLRIEVHPGDAVERGQVLVRIDAAPLDPRQTEELRSRLDAAEDTAREAEAALRASETQSAYAQRDLERMSALAESGISSAENLDAARTTAANRSRELQAARARLNAARHQSDVIRASLQAAGRRDGTLTISSPVTGRVLAVHHESEGTVSAGAPILDVGDPSSLEVVIDVVSREAVRIKRGHRVHIDGWGDDPPLQARVDRIEPSAFTKVSPLGIEEQRVNVIATLDQPPPGLGDRFEVQAHVEIWSGDVVKLPSTAVFRDDEAWAVFAVRGGRARLQPVAVGHRSTEEVEITSGIASGTRVINHPSDQIRDGVRVSG